MINWKNITSIEFEELCYQLMEVNKFTNIQWYGKGGGDKGRDILCDSITNPLKNITIVDKWLVQCKRYTEKKITKSNLSDAFNSAREHNIDCFLLIITDTLSSGIKDWIKSIQSDFKFKIMLWEELDLRREVNKNTILISSLFPHLLKKNNTIEFYEMQEPIKTYYCNEFEEVGFQIMNTSDEERNIKLINEFIKFIKVNDIHLLQNEN